MPDRKTVMISSTARDLPEHRDEVRDGCHRAGFSSEQMMEYLPALNADAVEASLKMVEQADIYIGIFAYRYGYIPDGATISITEMEYNRAVELNKPRLIFFIHDDHPVTGKDFEHGEASIKLQAFKDRVGSDRVAAFFKSPGDLRGHVVEALIAWRKDQEGNEPNDPKTAAQRLHRRTVIPAPPKPYIAHPYTLSQTRDLIGRRDELNALTDWVAKPGSPAYDNAIFCFVAIGGMGKSALTWKWFNDIAPEEMPDLAGRLWWSFYESDAHFENFLNRALCYVGGLAEDDVRDMPWHDRENLLLQHLNDKPFLLVLDGLERILLAYNRMDASSLADDEYDEQTANYVAGAVGLPASAAQSFTGQHRLRQTTDSRAGYFFRKLAQVKKSRILVSTRLYPLALQLPNSDPCPGCFAQFLKGLGDGDAVSLWRQLGISGSRRELVILFNSIENHSLLIQALAGEIARDRKTPGDFAAWRKNNSSFDPASLPATQVKSHVLQHALAGLGEGLRETLAKVVALRTPATYDTLEALTVGDGKVFGQRQSLDQALAELEDRGLIGWDREANRYDAHPIVRSTVWKSTSKKKKTKIYEAIEAYFRQVNVPRSDNVASLDDLIPAVERYYTLTALGRLNEASEYFRDWLANPALNNLSAYRELVGWLEMLMGSCDDVRDIANSEKLQCFMIDLLAMSYLRIGRLHQAKPLLERRITIANELNDSDQIIMARLSIGFALRWFGELRRANWELMRAYQIMQEAEKRFREAGILLQLGHVSLSVGDHQASRLALQRSCFMFRDKGNTSSEVHALVGLGSLALREKGVDSASKLSQRAWEIAKRSGRAPQLIRASLFRGRTAMELGEFKTAEDNLQYGLEISRKINSLSDELYALVALSTLEFRRNRISIARARIEDIWEQIPDGADNGIRSGAYNVLADILRAENDNAGAIDAATKAYRAAWCDGPPWAYHWGLEKAKAHLQALNAPEPAMPPFDESNYEKMPEVEINPKDDYWVDPNEPLEALLDLDN